MLITANNLTDVSLDTWLTEKAKVPMTFKEDPVVLACGAYRIGSYLNLEDVEPTAEDRELGARVRKHYMDKLVIQRLRGGQVSAFREKLGAFLVDNRPIYQDEIGMLYHLPYFYFEDLAREELMLSSQTVTPRLAFTDTLTLQPLSILTLKRRGGSAREFWWKDDQNRPYCISVREGDPSLMLYQSLWDFASITVESHILSKPFLGTDRYYFRLVNNRLRGIGNGVA